MKDVRQLEARFVAAHALGRGEACGLLLEFRPERARLEGDAVRDFAELGPEPTIPTVAGLGKVLRILKAARIAAPSDPRVLLGDGARALALLERARGVRVRLSVRRRARLSFVAWTDRGVETVSDVADVVEGPLDYVVMRRGSRPPVRIPRAAVVRRQTRHEGWYEVLGIERA